ncbi:diacylglycerol kinase family protein [Paenibacillus albicereus]|uniref:Diacylglycerol kinase family protein n=1 Tax=Paenibacillus albicereus TaxID=2726185 RepID=A0A6H2GYX6_9BACL|nr:diacylglycerol kinase family protein [Paenibacillus albicereus]QJC52549.1 diacylglycerol kinase family protein [Paenibacillus albicereus]
MARPFRDSLSDACAGIAAAIRSERNMRIHLAAGAAACALAAWLGIGPLQWAALTLAISLVLAAELMNTAVERAVDLASGGKLHPLAKVAKDAAAGAVLVCAAASAVIGLLVLGPPLWRLLAV